MIFNRASFILLFILICAAITRAQGASAAANRCTLAPSQMSQSQELKGLWPGMTVEQVKALVPSLEMGKVDEMGLSKTSFSPDFNPNIKKDAFQGVRTVSLDFLDGQLISVWLGYNESFKWRSVDEMVKAITQSLKLPAAWEAKGRGQQLRCGDLELSITMVAGSPTLRVSDEAAREKWEKRRADKAEEAEP
jgi:hypothetical protein